MSSPPLRRTIRIRALSRSFRAGTGSCIAEVAALEDVTVEIRSGEVVVIAGPPGAGKTSLLLCAAGLLRCDAGMIDRGLPVLYRDLARAPSQLSAVPSDAAVFLDSVERASRVVVATLPEMLERALANQCAVVLAGRDAATCLSLVAPDSTVTVVHMRLGRIGFPGAGSVHRVAEGSGGGL